MTNVKNRTWGFLKGLLKMLLVLAGVAAFLAVVNWLPSLGQKEYARRFSSLYEARRSTGMASALVPSYFPEGTAWPPAFIVAQRRPYQAIVMEFRQTATGKTSLSVIESSSQDEVRRLQRIRFTDIREETLYQLKGRPATLRVGTCESVTECSELTWRDRDVSYSVLFASSPFELIKVAESMIR
jgi:hypothetical protein